MSVFENIYVSRQLRLCVFVVFFLCVQFDIFSQCTRKVSNILDILYVCPLTTQSSDQDV